MRDRFIFSSPVQESGNKHPFRFVKPNGGHNRGRDTTYNFRFKSVTVTDEHIELIVDQVGCVGGAAGDRKISHPWPWSKCITRKESTRATGKEIGCAHFQSDETCKGKEKKIQEEHYYTIWAFLMLCKQEYTISGKKYKLSSARVMKHFECDFKVDMKHALTKENEKWIDDIVEVCANTSLNHPKGEKGTAQRKEETKAMKAFVKGLFKLKTL